jgi:hypothetical protein
LTVIFLSIYFSVKAAPVIRSAVLLKTRFTNWRLANAPHQKKNGRSEKYSARPCAGAGHPQHTQSIGIFDALLYQGNPDGRLIPGIIGTAPRPASVPSNSPRSHS